MRIIVVITLLSLFSLAIAQSDLEPCNLKDIKKNCLQCQFTQTKFGQDFKVDCSDKSLPKLDIKTCAYAEDDKRCGICQKAFTGSNHKGLSCKACKINNCLECSFSFEDDETCNYCYNTKAAKDGKSCLSEPIGVDFAYGGGKTEGDFICRYGYIKQGNKCVKLNDSKCPKLVGCHECEDSQKCKKCDHFSGYLLSRFDNQCYRNMDLKLDYSDVKKRAWVAMFAISILAVFFN